MAQEPISGETPEARSVGDFVGSLFPGAVLLIEVEGKQRVVEAYGEALRYADAEGTVLPPEGRAAITPDTIFDMASISKLFTTVVIMQLVQEGKVDLDATVASYLPQFAANGKGEITVRQLLTHTSGLVWWLPLYQHGPDRAARIELALTAPPDCPPQTRFIYSDLNLITLGALAEDLTGQRLDELVTTRITAPLGMRDTGYNPPPDRHHRVAATEYQQDTGRGMVRGSVHDENAWSLDGIAGHAGIFSTAADMAKLCEAFLNDGADLLRPETNHLMFSEQNAGFPQDPHGLGFDLDRPRYMGALSGPRTAGHTGFTGTSLVIDPIRRCFVLLLTNRVHPRREWTDPSPARRFAAAQALALATE